MVKHVFNKPVGDKLLLLSPHQVDEPSIPLQGLFSSMQNDLTAIKKHAEEAHNHIAAIHDDPQTIIQLENKLQQVTSELVKTQEELKKNSAGKLKRAAGPKRESSSLHLPKPLPPNAPIMFYFFYFFNIFASLNAKIYCPGTMFSSDGIGYMAASSCFLVISKGNMMWNLGCST